jgi:CMP/dCMP kinase
MEAIILCGYPAAGKTTVGELISKKLGCKLVGVGDILKEMAKERGYTVTGSDWWDTTEGMRFAKERETNPNFDWEADKKLIKKLEEGNIVVTSYTAPWISKTGFKVWLKGNVKNRAERMAKRDGTDITESTNALKVRDTENKKLYKNLYDIDFGNDLTPFDLVVDTNDIIPEQVADIIIKKYKEKQAN